MSANDVTDPRPPAPRLYRTLSRLESPFTRLAGLTCRDFARLTAARCDRPLTAGETIRLRMHGLACRLCRGFSGQFQLINDLVHESMTDPRPGADGDEALQRIRDRVVERTCADDSERSREDGGLT